MPSSKRYTLYRPKRYSLDHSSWGTATQHSDRRTDEDNAAVMTQCKGGVYFFLLCFVSREINISILKIMIAYFQKLIVSIWIIKVTQKKVGYVYA